MALKVFRHQELDPIWRARFLREIQALEKLSHPRILPVLEWGEGPRGELWYSMEYSPKETLSQVFRKRLAPDSGLNPSSVLTLARGLSQALGYLHSKRIVHRDLKPENLLVDPNLEVTVMDFGLAKDLDRSEITQEGMVMGTPRYMSPEQVRGDPVLASSDVYQVGLILYQAATGGLPLEGKSPFDTAMRRMKEEIPRLPRQDLPPAFREILARMLCFSASDRFLDMNAVQDALETQLGGLGQEAPEEGTWVRGPAPGAEKDRVAREAPTRSLEPRESLGPRPQARVSRPSEAPHRARNLALALGFGAALAALGLAWGTRSPPRPKLRDLLVEGTRPELEFSFSTDLRVRSYLQLTPPEGAFLPISAEASRLHAARIEIPAEVETLELVLESPDGARFRQGVFSPSEGSGGLRTVRVEVSSGRARIQFETPTETRCQVRARVPSGRFHPALEKLSGGTQHLFEVHGLASDTALEYQIECDSGEKSAVSRYP